MDYRQMTAPCGLDCFNCPLYAASTSEDLQKLIADRLNILLEKAKEVRDTYYKGKLVLI